MIYGVIMAGGKGERFWPLSRAERPKQFLTLTSDRTMLAETIERVRPLIPEDRIRIVTGESMAQHILRSMPNMTTSHILKEPVGRNTCLAIGLAAVHLQKEDPHAVMVVLSADHLIRPPEKLLRILEDGCTIAAAEDRLITIGIVPTRPETAYGYIKVGDLHTYEGESVVHAVSLFAEKPKLTVAQEYYYSRQYLWNSGMFIWSAGAILQAISSCRPDIYKQLFEYGATIGTAQELPKRSALYKNVESISIDYAVLEKASNVLVIKADMVWDDVGSWNALERYKDRTSDNNVLVGETEMMDTYETTVYNDADGLIACIGVADLVVVRSANITLVAHKTKVNQVKELLARLGQDEKLKKYL
ncbi:MAG: sugar phosphate nucleotidyltransferase [Candidatus Zixiibacteriota bacterium]